MKYKSENLFLFVEGIQFINGEYKTTDKNEIEKLKRYSDVIKVVEDKSSKAEKSE